MISEATKEKKLYLVNLGGKVKGSHIEVHDVRWVIGDKIEDTFDQLRVEWFGNKQGLHIDSFLHISFVDGYEINISEGSSSKAKDYEVENSSKGCKSNKPKLWFINLGGYNPNQLNEQHHFRLVVAKNSNSAKRVAKNKWISSNLYKHTDNINTLNNLYAIDNCHLIYKIRNWKIDLKKDQLNRSQEFIPDWFGYMRIDKN
tara:strand:+ start:9675 stop:10277 length:603 start_codon:yes stop_codon:yes gene_type:complete